MGRLKGAAELAMETPQVSSPYVGMRTGFNRQEELSKSSAMNRIIAGKGLRIEQTSGGVIVHSTAQQTSGGTNTITSGVAIGTISSINENGIYTIQLSDGSTITTDKFLFVNNNLQSKCYKAGDTILVHQILAPNILTGEIKE